MPDMSHQRDRVDEFARRAPGLPSTSRRLKGGVMLNRNEKSYTVNIRPSLWKDKSKFWIRRQSYESAQYLADAIFYYIGKSPFHFKDANLIFPDLDFIGVTDVNMPVRLTTMEMRLKYVRSIAGDAFSVQREDFIKQVTDVMDRDDVIRQEETLLRSIAEAAVRVEGGARPVPETAALRETAAGAVEEAAASQEAAAAAREDAAAVQEEAVASREEAASSSEEAAISGDETAVLKEETAIPAQEAFRNEGDDLEKEPPPIEEDSTCLLAIRQSQRSSVPLFSDVSERAYPALLLEGSDTDLVSCLGLSQGYAPSFEINLDSSGKSLESAEQSFGSTWFTFDQCPTNNYEDKEKLQSWMDTLAKLNTNASRSGELSSSVAPELESDFDSVASLSLMDDFEWDPSDSITAHTIVDAEQRNNNPKRRKIEVEASFSLEETESLFRWLGWDMVS